MTYSAVHNVSRHVTYGRAPESRARTRVIWVRHPVHAGERTTHPPQLLLRVGRAVQETRPEPRRPVESVVA